MTREARRRESVLGGRTPRVRRGPSLEGRRGVVDLSPEKANVGQLARAGCRPTCTLGLCRFPIWATSRTRRGEASRGVRPSRHDVPGREGRATGRAEPSAGGSVVLESVSAVGPLSWRQGKARPGEAWRGVRPSFSAPGAESGKERAWSSSAHFGLSRFALDDGRTWRGEVFFGAAKCCRGSFLAPADL
jgi:hypothetical protein